MRISLLISLAILAATQPASLAADQITYAIGGPAHRPVDTFVNVPMDRDEMRLLILQGEMAGGAAKHCPEAEIVEIRSGQPFLSEPTPRESLFKRSDALFLHFPPRKAHEVPQSIEAPPTSSPLDGMPLAAL